MRRVWLSLPLAAEYLCISQSDLTGHGRIGTWVEAPFLILVFPLCLRLCGVLGHCLGQLPLGLSDDMVCNGLLLRAGHFLKDHFLNLGHCSIHQLGFGWHVLILVVIDCLLHRSQRRHGALQLQGFDHIFPLPEPQDKIVALLHAFLDQPRLVVQLCQLIGPFLRILFLLIFLQNGNLVLKG